MEKSLIFFTVFSLLIFGYNNVKNSYMHYVSVGELCINKNNLK